MSRPKQGWTVAGDDPTPDGYHDHLLYRGTSRWQAFKAVRAALRNEMVVSISRYLEAR